MVKLWLVVVTRLSTDSVKLTLYMVNASVTCDLPEVLRLSRWMTHFSVPSTTHNQVRWIHQGAGRTICVAWPAPPATTRWIHSHSGSVDPSSDDHSRVEGSWGRGQGQQHPGICCRALVPAMIAATNDFFCFIPSLSIATKLMLLCKPTLVSFAVAVCSCAWVVLSCWYFPMLPGTRE